MCDLHCEQHSSAKGQQNIFQGGRGSEEYPAPHHLPLSYIPECKDTTYNTLYYFQHPNECR